MSAMREGRSRSVHQVTDEIGLGPGLSTRTQRRCRPLTVAPPSVAGRLPLQPTRDEKGLLTMSALITLLFLAVVGWNTFTQIMARQQTSISCSYDVATARKIVSQSFGMWWRAVPGNGDDNYKSKRGSNAPTLSVSYGMAESGGCHVDIWCSHGTKRYGVLHHAQLVWRKKRAVSGALARAELIHSQAPTRPGGNGTVSVGSPRPQAPAQPTIDVVNSFGFVGADRVSTRM